MKKDRKTDRNEVRDKFTWEPGDVVFLDGEGRRIASPLLREAPEKEKEDGAP